MRVSRDIVDDDGQVSPDVTLVRVEFNYEGDPALWYYMSPEIATRLGFIDRTVLPLPDQFPPWVDEVTWWAVCAKCFDDSRKPGMG